MFQLQPLTADGERLCQFLDLLLTQHWFQAGHQQHDQEGPGEPTYFLAGHQQHDQKDLGEPAHQKLAHEDSGEHIRFLAIHLRMIGSFHVSQCSSCSWSSHQDQEGSGEPACFQDDHPQHD